MPRADGRGGVFIISGISAYSVQPIFGYIVLDRKGEVDGLSNRDAGTGGCLVVDKVAAYVTMYLSLTTVNESFTQVNIDFVKMG